MKEIGKEKSADIIKRLCEQWADQNGQIIEKCNVTEKKQVDIENERDAV